MAAYLPSSFTLLLDGSYCQTMTLVSSDADAICVPRGLSATPHTVEVWPTSVSLQYQSSSFSAQIRMVSS
ncbi:hypothetical protein CCR75_008230 [Bremia lactucae]|uniref:Uncharacterized protein n=1 Tax=Bremia lactucae TaxID=4779 RepID=A0A976FIR2_BRELC|nr:hypothetical protein CCR75_008230 [Bremia lactucae]